MILLITGGFLTSRFWSKIYLYSVFSCLYYTEGNKEGNVGEGNNDEEDKEKIRKYKFSSNIKSTKATEDFKNLISNIKQGKSRNDENKSKLKEYNTGNTDQSINEGGNEYK